MIRYIFTVFIILLHINLLAQWIPQNPYPTSNDLCSITFPSDSIGFTVGTKIVMKSTDNGDTWETLYIPIELNAYWKSVHFINDTLGFICGNDRFMKTTDGGITWEGNENLIGYFTSTYFTSPLNGFMTSENNNIYKTTDGGDNWNSQELVTGNSGLSDVYFLNSDTGYCIGYQEIGMDQYNGKIFKTENGGISWIEVATTSTRLNEIRFTSDDFGIAVGSYGEIAITKDGGSNWDEQNMGYTFELTSVLFQADTSILIAGNNWGEYPQTAVICFSPDGGNSWNQLMIPDSGPLNSITKSTDSTLRAVGPEGTLLYSNDFGVSWELLSKNIVGEAKWLHAIHFLDTLTGMIVGQGGIVLKTNDGGENWSLLETNNYGNIREFCFIDSNILIANTDFGIYKSIDGGYNWEQKSNTSTWFVDFVSSDIGFASEFSNYMTGKLFKTNDGGENWVLTKEFDERITEIQFLNETTGYVLGMYSVYKTIDGGATWLKKSVGTTRLLSSFYFTNQNTGYSVVGSGTEVYKTINSGDTWSSYNLPGGTYNSIKFLNDSIGFIVGYYGTIIKTEDAGNNWFLQESTTNDHLTSIALLGNGLAYAIGGGSTILQTENIGGKGVGINSSSEPHRYISNHFELLVYPNPTISSVTLEYKLTKNSHVDIVITDITGLELQHIENDRTNIGTHKINVNLNNKKAGLYFFVITINGQKEVIKVIKTNGS